MKLAPALIALATLAGCVSTREFDADRAYAKCDTIKVPTSRDRCIAEAVSQSERERQRAAERQQELLDTAEQRELDRVIAGAEQD